MRRNLGSLLALALMAAPTSALAETATKAKDTAIQVDKAKPRLGVHVMTLGPVLRTFFGSKDKSGVLVTRVEAGSPAALAGIAPGDLLQKVGGTVVDEASDVASAVATAAKDQTLRIELLRKLEPKTLEVKVDTVTSFLDVAPRNWLRDMMERARDSQSV